MGALTALEPTFSTKDAAGPILVTVLGMVAEMERKFIRERQQAVAQGTFNFSTLEPLLANPEQDVAEDE